ncbi:prepilin peptidase [Thermoleophilia bacterium SCSIO 60948]|nr:prepilin peptidase [Thermoleophilia bacterium SCSIO 60948]
MPALILFPLGLALGSFVTALAHRLPRDENWVSARSECPGCSAPIRAHDNVPLLSWLLLGGRCRNCAEPIAVRYPLTELGLALLYVGTYLALGDDDLLALGLGLVLCTLLVAVTLTDLDLRIIPNKIVLAGSVVALVGLALGAPELLPDRVLAAAIAGGLLFVIAMAHPRGMGMGDAKLVGMMGLYLGASVAPAVLVGLLAGSLAGAALFARHGQSARKMTVPFGPFLALGGIVGLWFGPEIVDWYATRFL